MSAGCPDMSDFRLLVQLSPADRRRSPATGADRGRPAPTAGDRRPPATGRPNGHFKYTKPSKNLAARLSQIWRYRFCCVSENRKLPCNSRATPAHSCATPVELPCTPVQHRGQPVLRLKTIKIALKLKRHKKILNVKQFYKKNVNFHEKRLTFTKNTNFTKKIKLHEKQWKITKKCKTTSNG